MLSKIELKAKQYGKLYVKNNMNGTKTARALYNVKNDRVAEAIASENLSKPIFQKEILNELDRKGVNNDKVSNIHQRNLEQDTNIPASNNALDMYYKLAGSYEPERKITLNINPDNINKLIDSKLNELKQLRAEG